MQLRAKVGAAQQIFTAEGPQGWRWVGKDKEEERALEDCSKSDEYGRRKCRVGGWVRYEQRSGGRNESNILKNRDQTYWQG